MILLLSIWILLLVGVYIIYVLPFSGSNVSDERNQWTVVVPFRNEVGRIDQLLESIKKQSKTSHVQWLFVDDHSSDSTAEKIEKTLSGEEVTFDIIQLDKEAFGKKAAVKKGVEQASHEQIRLLDADVKIPNGFSDYLSSVQLENEEVLSSGLLSQEKNILSRTELIILQFFTRLLFKIQKPVLSNSTSLHFRKSDFLKWNPYEDNYQISSGDDMFLMAKARKKGASFRWDTDRNLVAVLKGECSSRQFISQRLRWAGKMKNLFFIENVFLFVAFLFLQITLVEFVIQEMWGSFLLLLTTIWLVLMFSQLQKVSWLDRLLSLPMIMIFPYYSLILYIFALIVSTTWKDRRVENS